MIRFAKRVSWQFLAPPSWPPLYLVRCIIGSRVLLLRTSDLKLTPLEIRMYQYTDVANIFLTIIRNHSKSFGYRKESYQPTSIQLIPHFADTLILEGKFV